METLTANEGWEHDLGESNSIRQQNLPLIFHYFTKSKALSQHFTTANPLVLEKHYDRRKICRWNRTKFLTFFSLNFQTTEGRKLWRKTICILKDQLPSKIGSPVFRAFDLSHGCSLRKCGDFHILHKIALENTAICKETGVHVSATGQSDRKSHFIVPRIILWHSGLGKRRSIRIGINAVAEVSATLLLASMR